MSELTGHGQTVIADLAQRHGLSEGAVIEMARALSRGGGTMAQFSIPELGGSGQWMAGGMTMVGDMFNTGLRMRVEQLCGDLTSAMAAGPLFALPQTLAGAAWWPAELGQPAAVGGQNQYRYAYFPEARRIAWDMGNGAPVVLLDTLEHRIGGFSQQQSGPGDPFAGVSFSSQSGQFALASLPRVGAGGPGAGWSGGPVTGQGQGQGDVQGQVQQSFGQQGQAQWQSPAPAPSQPVPAAPEPAMPAEPQVAAAAPAERAPERPAPAAAPAPAGGPDPLALIEKLAALHASGILTDEEFSKKKAELLARL